MRPRIAVVLGTRPEIVKLAPLLALLSERGSDHLVVHTGQQYSADLDAVFFDELGLAEPTHRLAVGSGTHAEQLARIVDRLAPILRAEAPDVVVVQGDTNTGLGAALVASQQSIPIAHVEAGLRSHDWRMPEEANRRLIDALATWCFAPTAHAAANLAAEGIGGFEFATDHGPRRQRVEVVGNTIVDAVRLAAGRAEARCANYLASRGIGDEPYAVVTAHRAENVDDQAFLAEFVATVGGVRSRGIEPVWLLHPRAEKMLERFGLMADAQAAAKVVPPVGVLEMLTLERSAALVLTDSGGVQEEACILGVPCVVARLTSDRPETIEVGGAVLGGTHRAGLERAIDEALALTPGWQQPFGDGHASERILDTLLAEIVTR